MSYSAPPLMPLFDYGENDRTATTIRFSPEERAALHAIVEFESALLKAMGRRKVATVARIIREAIKLFVAQYWHEFGGQPTTPEETREKVARVVKDLRAHQSKQKATSVK